MRDVNPNAAKCMDKGLLGFLQKMRFNGRRKTTVLVSSALATQKPHVPCMLLRSLKGPEKEPDTVAVLPWG